tara:strand:+ start:26 stop:1648 length:1623 start_codon:yes stop_codon:yes gene_type:complete
MQDQAQKLAEYGRNGDIYVVHAAEGETVIPLEVLNANPKVKELLFNQMRDMGLDPQEFVVGSELNSINPDTGLPEFFFSSIFRSVKNAVKKVWKVVKKAAPIILPIAAAMFGVPFLGPMFGAGTFGASFLGSGIGTLAAGGSFKDALKAGVMAGGIGSLVSGFTGAGSFADNIGSSFTGATPVYAGGTTGPQVGTKYAASPWADALGDSAARQASAAASKAQWAGLGKGEFLKSTLTGEGQVLGDTPTSVTDPSSGKLKPGFTLEGAARPSIAPGGGSLRKGLYKYKGGGGGLPGDTVANNPLEFTDGKTLTTKQYTAIDNAARRAADLKAGQDTLLAKNWADSSFFGGKPITIDDVRKFDPTLGLDAAPAGAVKAAAARYAPSTLATYGPSLALAGTGAYFGGAFDPPPSANIADPFDKKRVTGQDLLDKDRDKYMVQNLNPYQRLWDSRVPSRYAADGGYMQKPEYMNMGGTPQYPRREMLVEGPGTERSDDIPAMLSDGEFVMNARAVRGADPSGDGNRQAGAKNLYNMMRNFEMRS